MGRGRTLRVKGFFTGLLVMAQVVERLLPHVKQHMQDGKNPLTNMRQKYKQAARAARFIYRRGLHKGQQERQHIARRLLKMGYKPDIVCKMTGLARRELEQL